MPGASEGSGPRSAPALWAGFAACGMTLRELWMGQLALGGLLSLAELADTLGERREPTWQEHDVVAAALNDWFTERGSVRRVPYSEALRGSRPGEPSHDGVLRDGSLRDGSLRDGWPRGVPRRHE